MIVSVFSEDRDDLRLILNGMNYVRDYGYVGEYFVLLDGFADEWRLGVLAWVYEFIIQYPEEDGEFDFILDEFEAIPDLDYLMECMNVSI